MTKYNVEDIRRIVFDEEVKFIRLQFVDISGTLKNVAIPVEKLEKALAGELVFDGSSIEGMVRRSESDMYLHPDLSTFKVFPWRSSQGKVARIICDIHKASGKEFEGDPRMLLKKSIQKAKAQQLTIKISAELEFYLFHTDENNTPTRLTHDNAGYFDLGPIDLGENVRRDIVLTLQEMDIDVLASHHEVAPGQHEIDFELADVLQACDDIVTAKLVVKAVASKHGLHGTFMPKPISNISGSGMHINIGIYDVQGKSVLYDSEDEANLSELAYHFMGGLLEHSKALTALGNPTINSYKRLVAGYEAPIRIGWSTYNESPLVRVPVCRNQEATLEYRSPDPAANPYLIVSGMIEAGLDGIHRRISCQGKMEKEQLEKKVKAFQEPNLLPTTLLEALEELDQDQIIKDYLGEIYLNYRESKLKEWTEYMTVVHEWEVEKYISKY